VEYRPDRETGLRLETLIDTPRLGSTRGGLRANPSQSIRNQAIRCSLTCPPPSMTPYPAVKVQVSKRVHRLSKSKQSTRVTVTIVTMSRWRRLGSRFSSRVSCSSTSTLSGPPRGHPRLLLCTPCSLSFKLVHPTTPF
jgi:hypothetical protein